MKIGPKYKICKRLGGGIFEKCQTQKYTISEARRGKVTRGRRPRAMSDFGRQLIEKQKIRYTYGIAERQMTRYVKEAGERAASPAAGLYETLESRLDNVVYRMGLAATRRLARQIVSHGHIRVNGRKVTVPSFMVSEGDTITVREGSRTKALFTNLAERLKDYQQPAWLRFDEGTFTGQVVGRPEVEGAETTFDLGAVLEFYSR